MARPDVEYVVENAKVHALGVPNDPQYAQQWSLAKVNAAAAWDRTVGSRQVVVAVIDTGIDHRHPDLAANMWVNDGEVAGNGRDDDGNGQVDDVNGFDFRDNDGDPMDITSAQNPGHGTHCAGIIGAVGNNATGVVGMSQQISLMAIRFLGADGSGDLMAAIKAIDYAIANKADVISASWGAKIAAAQAGPLVEAIGRADAAGIPFVAAAANDGANNDTTDMYPANAAFPNMITVAASGNDDSKPSWSNYGRAKVAVSSPGLNILSTLPSTQYGQLSGTSMATPLVAGLVGLMKASAIAQGKAGLSGPEARSILQTTGAKVAIETACMCRVDAAAALTALETDQLTVVPAAGTFAPGATGKFTSLGGGTTFSSANPAVLEVAADGSYTAKAVGETTVSVSNGRGASASSLALFVKEGSDGGGGGGQQCPLPDPQMCDLLCLIDPTLPWCAR